MQRESAKFAKGFAKVGRRRMALDKKEEVKEQVSHLKLETDQFIIRLNDLLMNQQVMRIVGLTQGSETSSIRINSEKAKPETRKRFLRRG